MNEIGPDSQAPATAALVRVLQKRLDALVRREGGEAEVIDEITTVLAAAPDASRDIAAVIDQRYRLGDISGELFQSLTAKISGRALPGADYATTVGLVAPPISREAQVQAASPPIELGRVLRDRYVLEEHLGRGGMGSVFRALDRYRADLPAAHQYVAIKILHGKSDNRSELLAKLRREFYCAQSLAHPNIVKVYELDRDGDVDFFTMELLDGELLSSVMERFRSRPMHRPQALGVIREIGAGLAHAHARGVVHSDLKPNNVMITHSGEVRILDFGASSIAGGTASATATPAYASCELLEGRVPDPRDDIYAFACLAYELLAGTHPFQRRSSTLARDLGVVPVRPPMLNRRQWKALTMGLSWHRGGRSVTVGAWLKSMNVEKGAMRRLPGVHELNSAIAPRPPTLAWVSPTRAMGALATLLVMASVWMLFMAFSRSDMVGAGGIASIPTAAKSPIADPAGPAAAPEAATEAAPAATLPAASPPTVALPSHRIRLSDKFAEIRLHRSALTPGGSAVEWWTEAASAKPGIDYVPQGRAKWTFAKGENSASFFIKLIPKATRAQSQVFYLAVAEVGRGASGRIERTAIWLPAT
jgi:serine/threonine protein kinase